MRTDLFVSTAALVLAAALVAVGFPAFGVGAVAGEAAGPTSLRPADLPPPAQLPARAAPVDPLVMMDGTPVKTRGDWVERRRPEILALAQHYLYGYSPPERLAADAPPPEVVDHDPKALDGAARWRTVRVFLFPGKDDAENQINVQLVTPAEGAGPFPAVLCINWKDFVRNPSPKGVEMLKYIVARGYAVAGMMNAEGRAAWKYEPVHRGPAVQDERLKKERFLYDWGMIASWSWRARRALDGLLQQPDLDSRRIAVEGLSRHGPAALWAAAMDPRIALLIVHQGMPSVEPRAGSVNQPADWWPLVLRQSVDNLERLPIDFECVLAAVAPRPVLVSTSRTSAWNTYPPSVQAVNKAASTWRLLGADVVVGKDPGAEYYGNKKERFGKSGLYGSGPLRLFIRDGEHEYSPDDWKHWLDFADEYFRPKPK